MDMVSETDIDQSRRKEEDISALWIVAHNSCCMESSFLLLYDAKPMSLKSILKTPRLAYGVRPLFVVLSRPLFSCLYTGCVPLTSIVLHLAMSPLVNKQRMEMKFREQGKKSSMTASKIRTLQEAGFVW